MKVTIEYEDVDDVRLALDAVRYASANNEAYNKIRGILKHCEPSEETTKILEEIRELLIVRFD
jgi:hypothetical protein